jgi:transposase
VDQEVVEGPAHMQSIITLEPAEGAFPVCSGCGVASRRLHVYGTRRVRDLNLAHARVHLVVPARKLRCDGCGTIRAESHDFLGPYRRHTVRFERAVADLCRHLPIKQVAEHFDLRGTP